LSIRDFILEKWGVAPVEESLPLAEVYKDLPRGRPGWNEEMASTLQQAGQDIGDVSEQEIASQVAG